MGLQREQISMKGSHLLPLQKSVFDIALKISVLLVSTCVVSVNLLRQSFCGIYMEKTKEMNEFY